MLKRDAEIALELKKRLSSAIQLVDFRIFGSRAKGLADPYSDMDVFIEVESIDRKIRDLILDVVWDVSFENGLVIAPLIFTRDEIEKTAMRSSSIVTNIEEEGIRV